MKELNEIYKVSEKTYTGKRANSGECGIAYYKSYVDALKDFYQRVNRLEEIYNTKAKEQREGSRDVYCTFEPNVHGLTYHFRLERHDIY